MLWELQSACIHHSWHIRQQYTPSSLMLCHKVIEVSSSDEEQHIARYKVDQIRSFQKQLDTSVSYLRHFKTSSNYKTTMQCSTEAVISKTTILNNMEPFETQLATLACFHFWLIFLLYFHELTDPRRPKASEMVSLGNDNELHYYLYMLNYIFACLPILAVVFQQLKLSGWHLIWM